MTRWKGRLRTDKLLSMLGMARKAGRLKAGYDVSVELIRNGKAALTIAAGDISEKTYKNLEYEAGKKDVPVLRLETDMQSLSRACGIKAGVIVLTDQGFAKSIENLALSCVKQKEERIYDD